MAFYTNGLDKQWNFLANQPELRGVELLNGMSRVPFVLGLTINAGATQATVEETVLTSWRAYTIQITDQHGNEAVGFISAISTPVNINTSALVSTDQWNFKAIIQTLNSTNPEKAFNDASFGVTITNPKSTSVSYDNRAGSGTPGLKINGSTVTDGGTYNAGSAAVGDVVILPVEILNNATAENGAFILSSVTVSGDASFQSHGITPVVIVPQTSSNAWSLLMSTASAGAKSATLTFTSTRSSNVSYVATINLTVA